MFMHQVAEEATYQASKKKEADRLSGLLSEKLRLMKALAEVEAEIAFLESLKK